MTVMLTIVERTSGDLGERLVAHKVFEIGLLRSLLASPSSSSLFVMDPFASNSFDVYESGAMPWSCN